jgi:predicted YcjX-like family ATPase
LTLLDAARGLLPVRRTLRIGVTGLARAGKTAFLTSVAANLLALGAGLPAMPALSSRLAGRSIRVAVADAGAESLPRFDYPAHLAALDADPPHWPERTAAVSLLALDIDIARAGFAAALPPQMLRLELLDYPGEWLLDLPLLSQSFAVWSNAALQRLERHAASGIFLGFVRGLPTGAPADEAVARAGHALYRDLLHKLRDKDGLSLLQPGRFLMPPPGHAPPWLEFFPMNGSGPLAGLLARRYDKYQENVRRDLVAPGFGQVDRLVVLADVLSALSAGEAATQDAAAALGAVARALRWQNALPAFLPGWIADWLPWLGGIQRVAFAATKSDHVADRQRGNLAALIGQLTRPPERAAATTSAFAIAAIRCTEDTVMTLDGRPVSAVRGRLIGDDRLARSYPGEVPDRMPDAAFWSHPFFALPEFEPVRLRLGGRGGVPHIGLDTLVAFLLEEFLP